MKTGLPFETRSSADAEELRNVPQIQIVALEKACNIGMTRTVITIADASYRPYRACFGLLLQHLHLTPFPRHYHFLARRSMSEALMLQAFRLDHLSVRTCEQWPHAWMHCYAVWGGECGRAQKRCIRFWW